MSDWSGFSEDEFRESKEILDRIEICLRKINRIQGRKDMTILDVARERKAELKDWKSKLLLGSKEFDQARKVCGQSELFVRLLDEET